MSVLLSCSSVQLKNNLKISWLLLLGFFIAMLYCNSLLAEQAKLSKLDNLYVGLDVLQTNYSTKEGYGRNVFAKNPMAYNVFVGYKLPRDFFVEAGYESTGTKKRSESGVKLRDFPGVLDPTLNGVPYTVNTKIQVEHPYFGVGVAYPISVFKNTSISGLIGVTATKIKAQMDYSSNGGRIPTLSFIKRKIAPTVKLNLNHDFTSHFGVRFNVAWHRLTNFECKDDVHPVYRIKMKDGYAVGVGVIYSFF